MAIFTMVEKTLRASRIFVLGGVLLAGVIGPGSMLQSVQAQELTASDVDAITAAVGPQNGTGAVTTTQAQKNTKDIQIGAALDNVVKQFQTATQKWQGIIGGYAKRLFWLLATIEFAATGIRLVLKQAEMGEVLADLMSDILFIGFFYALLINETGAAGWLNTIITSMAQAGGDAVSSAGLGVGGITPGAILVDTGKILTKMWSGIGWTSLLDFETYLEIFMGLIIMVTMALVAAYMTEALVESYIVLSAGILVLGLGGSRWTKDHALGVVTYALSVGMKLLVMQLVVGVGVTILNGYANAAGDNPNSLQTGIEMVITIVVLTMLTKSLPQICQSLINGKSFSNGRAIMGATAAAATAAVGGAAVGAAMAGRAAAASGAGEGASSMLGRASAAIGASPVGRAGAALRDAAAGTAIGRIAGGVGRGAGAAVGGLGRAVAQEVVGKATGAPGHAHGTSGARMAHNVATGEAHPPRSGGKNGSSRPVDDES